MQESTLGNYKIGNTIGEGTFGKVKSGVHMQTGEKVAVKILEKDKLQDESDVHRMAKEIEILKKLRHPHIIQIYEIIDTGKEICLIMEYASGGELFEYIVKNQRVEEKQACRILLQILSGVEYMHKVKIVHRDLKPENLLFDQNKNIKIVDFGLSNTYKQDELLKTACGSPCYAAPEMIQGLKYSGYLIDIWSCGIVLYAMLCGYLPFEDSNTNQLYKKIIAGELTFPKFLSEHAKDLLKKILNTDPKKRYKISDIRNHPWARSIRIEEQSNLIGSETITVDEVVIEQLKNLYGVDPNTCKKLVMKNRHNATTTLYYLQIQKNKRTRNFNYYKKDNEELTQSHDINSTLIDSQNNSNNNTSRLKPGQSPQHKIIFGQRQSPSPQPQPLKVRPESPKQFLGQLKRDIIKRVPQKHIIPPQMKAIYQAVNNSISSVGTNTNGNTPINTNRKTTEESFSLDKVKPKVIGRDRAISAISEFTQSKPKPILKIHKGAFNFKCTTNREPDLLLEEIKKVMIQQSIKIIQQIDAYDMLCQVNVNIKFEIALRQIHNCEGLYLVKGHHLSGEWEQYQQTLNRLIQQLHF